MSVIVLGSMNVDLTTKVIAAPKDGETISALSFKKNFGGKGANQAIAIKRLNGNVTLSGALGNDEFGNYFHNVLVDEKIDDKYIKRVPTSTGLAFVTIDKDAENRIIIVHGANYEYGKDDVLYLKDLIKDSSICLTQLEMQMDVIEKFADLAYQYKKVFILNPAPAAELSDKLLKHVSILTPNETELALISKKNTNTIEEKISAAKALISKGVENVIVTLGKDGCLIVNKDLCKVIPSKKIKPVDTTAAGDAFNGALAYCLDTNYSLEEACEFANCAGALTCLKNGASSSLPTLNDVKKIL